MWQYSGWQSEMGDKDLTLALFHPKARDLHIPMKSSAAIKILELFADFACIMGHLQY
jgi:hypothetical protein